MFTTDGAVPLDNNLAEQGRKRIALLPKNTLCVATSGGGEAAAILGCLTSTCRRHAISPQKYLTQLLANLPDPPIRRVVEWSPERWLKSQSAPPAPSAPTPT